ncbi:DMT family transporter [Candidatus Rariloculus sp.]|uniref:DMT family transporter n=1 Tax=Candidatus Rariloculus sp. TaxID=3101265 RepID=UPI003D1353A9
MSSHPRQGIGPAAALTALTAIWGYNWVVMKFALADSPALTFSALRSVLSAAALFVVLISLRRPLKPVRGGAVIALGVLQTMGFVGFAALAVEVGTAGKSAVLAYTMPFWTLILAGLFLGERMRGVQWLAVLLAAGGLVGVLSASEASFGIADSLYALGAAWCWAVSNIVVKRIKLKGEEILNVSAWQMLLGGVGLSALAIVLDTEPVRWTVSFSLALGYNVVFATALAWLLWLFALNRLSAGVTGLATLGAPPFALAAAWLQLGEVPARSEAVGMVLIVCALTCLSVSGWQAFSQSTAAR